MPDDNCLFDRVFKPTQSSKKSFLINERKKISYKEFHFTALLTNDEIKNAIVLLGAAL